MQSNNNRPLLGCDIASLEAMFATSGEDSAILVQLREELRYRSTSRSKKLLKEIEDISKKRGTIFDQTLKPNPSSRDVKIPSINFEQKSINSFNSPSNKLMKLRFPNLGGGIAQGLDDAGIETFEGDYAHYVVRECIQNSLDAAASSSEPVIIEFGLKQVAASELPFLDDLRRALHNCAAYWSKHAKPREFFDNATKIADDSTLNLLHISDYGTTGVPGADDDDSQPWFGLVRSRGVSIKLAVDSGGSFGIGKDAPLAASALRTVIYSSRTEDGNVAVQGISRLTTHKGARDQTQGTGFIGLVDESIPSFAAIRDHSLVPDLFKRDRPGLDVWVVGFRSAGAEWRSQFIAAALRNFWPAIHFGRLVITIAGTRIDATTLPALMRDHQKEEAVRDAFPYYQAATASPHILEKTLPQAGHCRLFVAIGGRDLPRRICMTRQTGMVIYNYAPSTVRVPFAGLFCCDDKHGNGYLKALEPPAHDNWIAKRAHNPDQSRALKEIKNWIREALLGLIPDVTSTMINEGSIADLLPDYLPGGQTGSTEDTDITGKPAEPRNLISPEPPKPAVRTPGDGTAAKGFDDKPGGTDGNTLNPKPGDNEKTDGRTARAGGENPPGGGNAIARLPVQLRSFPDRAKPGYYQLVIRAAADHAGSLRIDAVTEDGGSDPCPLDAAYDEAGVSLSVSGNQISGIALVAGVPLRLSVKPKHFSRAALRASTL